MNIIDATHRFPQAPAAYTLSAEEVMAAAEPETRPAAPAPVEDIDRNQAIARIRAGLKARTGKTWSVTGGRGTAWGWIRVEAPPARRGEFGTMTPEDRATLAQAMGLASVHSQGLSIAASSAYYVEYVDRAEGREPRRIGAPYWD